MDISMQKRVNTLFLMFLAGLLLSNLIRTAVNVLPEDPLFLLTSDAMELIICGGLGVATLYWIVPSKKVTTKIIGVTLGIALLYGLAYLKGYRRESLTLGYTIDQLLSFIGLTVFFFCLIYFVKNIKYFINNNLHKTEIALQEAQYQLSRQQFDPHFLFNMFNSLYSMSLQQHPSLSDTILKMSSLMRYITDHGQNAKVPIQNEIEFIESYIAVQKTRFGKEANITFERSGIEEELYIAPLLLMTPVENAFKHGFYTNQADNFVDIQVNIVGNQLELRVKNRIRDKQHYNEDQREGKGLLNLQKRLDLSYPKKYEMQIKEVDSEYSLSLKIELNGNL